MSLFSVPGEWMPAASARAGMLDGMKMFMFGFQYPPQAAGDAKVLAGRLFVDLDSPMKFAVAANAVAVASAGHAFGFWIGWLEAARESVGGAGRSGGAPGRAPVTLTVVPREEPVGDVAAGTGTAQGSTGAKTLSLVAPIEATESVATLSQAGETGTRPAGLEQARDGRADDLKLISGIGPKLETVLNDLGIYHFDQIAGWTQQQVRWMDDYLRFRGRIDRDNWIGQAAALAAGGRDEYRKRFGREPG